jgi:hypothetical protein
VGADGGARTRALRPEARVRAPAAALRDERGDEQEPHSDYKAGHAGLHLPRGQQTRGQRPEKTADRDSPKIRASSRRLVRPPLVDTMTTRPPAWPESIAISYALQ